MSKTKKYNREQELVFVTYTSAPRVAARHPVARTAVRRRARIAAPSDRNQSENARKLTQAGPRVNMTRFRTHPKASKSTSKVKVDVLPKASIGPPRHLAILDPFVTQLGGSAWELLHYCERCIREARVGDELTHAVRFGFRTASMSLNAKSDWFSFLVSDAAASHAILSLVSLNRDLERGNAVSTATLHHRSNAIQHVRRRLGNVNDRMEREVLAGTVAILAMADCLDDSALNATAHIEGLAMIVNQPGGMPIAANEALSRLISWADMSYSSTWPSEPHLPTLFETRASTKPTAYAPASDLPIVGHLALNGYLAPALIQVVRLLNALPLRPPGDSSSAADRQKASRAVYNIERPLIVYRTFDVLEKACSAFSGMFRAAAQLYVLIALRALPIHAPKIKRWAATLSERIDKVWITESTHVYEWTAQTLLLWSYAVLIAAKPDLCNDTMSEGLPVLVELLTDMDITSMETVIAALRQITWAQDFGVSELDKLLSAADRSRRARRQAGRSIGP